MSVACSEGHVVYASAREGIDFGGVTSCMTITCILDDGSKVAGHDGIDKRVKPQIVFAIKGKIQATKRTVARVIAAGSGSCWTPFLQSQQELFDGMAKNDPRMKNLKGLDALRPLEPFLVSRNTDKFIEILSRDFGVQPGQVQFRNADLGRIQITAAGQLQVEE